MTLEKWADQLFKAEETKTPCTPLSPEIGLDDLAVAYEIQQLNIAKKIKAGRRIVGRKIGLTSAAVQKQLGVDQPDYGVILDDMVLSDTESVSISTLMQPKAEVEIALILKDDLDMKNPNLSDLISATAYALPAIEIVESRIENWNIKITDTIADNASSGLVVLGSSPKLLGDLDLRLCGMTMDNKGEQVSVGVGAACLGHPLNAAVWLAKKMSEMNTPLKAGDLIMTGALGPMVAVSSGDVLEARISGLGSVRVSFED